MQNEILIIKIYESDMTLKRGGDANGRKNSSFSFYRAFKSKERK